jgi:hypothetical protein
MITIPSLAPQQSLQLYCAIRPRLAASAATKRAALSVTLERFARVVGGFAQQKKSPSVSQGSLTKAQPARGEGGGAGPRIVNLHIDMRFRVNWKKSWSAAQRPHAFIQRITPRSGKGSLSDMTNDLMM